MGAECSPEEREFRYKTLYDAIHTIDDDIKQEMKNTDINSKKYCSFGLLNKDICKKYPFLLNKTFDSNAAKNKIFNYKDLIKKTEDKDFTYINRKFGFIFSVNFIFISNDFLEVIFGYVDKEIESCLKNKFEFIIGKECLIKRNIINSDSDSFRYITLYNELNEIQGNNTDFFLFIKDKKNRESAVNEILKNNLWNYFKKIKYNYRDEYKKIIDESNQEIGYVVRVSDIKTIDSFILRMRQKEKKEIEESLKQNPPKINVNNNIKYAS